MGAIFVRYLKQSRENKASLCAARRREQGAAGPRTELGWGLGACVARGSRGSRPSSPAFSACSPLRAASKATFHMPATTCLIEKRKKRKKQLLSMFL